MTELHRRAIERAYTDICTVSERVKYRKENGSTDFRDNIKYSDVPCRLSYGVSPVAQRGETVTEISQNILLFVPPEYEISAGSKIIVDHDGVIEDYIQSGLQKIYATHREICLSRAEERA